MLSLEEVLARSDRERDSDVKKVHDRHARYEEQIRKFHPLVARLREQVGDLLTLKVGDSWWDFTCGTVFLHTKEEHLLELRRRLKTNFEKTGSSLADAGTRKINVYLRCTTPGLEDVKVHYVTTLRDDDPCKIVPLERGHQLVCEVPRA